MNRRELFRKAAVISPGVILPGCGTVADLVLRSQYLIRTSQILAQLLPFFPFQHQASGIGQFTLSDPVFSMAPDINKVRVGLSTNLATASGLGTLSGIPALNQLGGKEASGTTQIACGLRYDRETRGIYLNEPALERFDLDEIPSVYTNSLRQIVNLLGPQFFDQHAIHTLEPSLAARFLNSMVVKPGGIALKFAP